MAIPDVTLATLRPPTTAGGPRPFDPFDGFFAGPPRPRADDATLLGIPAARVWMDVIDKGMHDGLYTYQAPLDGRSGPRVSIDGRSMLMLSSYDYLGLIGHPAIEAAAIEAIRTHGTGTGGVRLLTGSTTLHRELERELAAFKGTEAAVTFTSGYAAAIAVIGALFGPRDRVLMDARSHRSVIDACRLATVPAQRFDHNDPDSLDHALRRGPPARRTLVLVEGVYSMDGDLCPLPDIVAVTRRHRAFIMVDEAHSLGVLGAHGRGIDEHWGIDPREVDIWMGSLSKAIPSNGGFLAGPRELMIYLQHGAAPYMFSAALCPAASAAALAALRVIGDEPDRVTTVRRRAARLRDGLRAAGYDCGNSETPIVPVLLGDNHAAWRLSRALFDRGIVGCAVIPPAVPPGAARLRLCVTAAHSPGDIEEALAAFRALAPGGTESDTIPEAG